MLAQALRGRHRPHADGPRPHAQGRVAPDQPVPQSAAGVDDRPAEHAVRGVRGAAAGQDRGGDRVRDLRRRRRDHHGGVAQHRRAPHDLHAPGHRRGNAGVHHRPARPQRAAVAGPGPGAGGQARRPACSSTPGRTAPPCRSRRPASCSTTARSNAASDSSGPWSVLRSPSTRWTRPRGGRPILRRSLLAWEAELAQLPEFRESTLHVVTGLLLPIWRQLPHDGGHVYRLQTDEPAPELAKGQHPGASASSAVRSRRPGSQQPARRLRSSRPRTPSPA